MSREEQQDATDKHKGSQQRFSPMLQDRLYSFCPCAHKERYRDQCVGDEFTENKHQSIGQDFTSVVYFLVDISYGCNAGEQCAGVNNHQEAQ